MKISIAMTSFNGEKYIEEQFLSIRNQTILPHEVVVSDDASEDRTCNLINSLKKSMPFEIRLIENEVRVGYCQNFNIALTAITGDLIFLSDQDDFWLPHKIESILNEAKSNDYLMYFHDAYLVNSILNHSGLTVFKQLFNAGMSLEEFQIGSCSAVKRGLLDICLPIPDKYPAHDGWLATWSSGMGKKRFIAEPLQLYRRHNENTSQFIGARLSRISKFSLFNENLKKIIFLDCSCSERDLEGLKMVQEHAVSIGSKKNITSEQFKNIQMLLNFINKKVYYLEKRLNVRSMRFPLRTYYASKLLITKELGSSYGIINAARDILFGQNAK
jgi:glycosyltransferase involved in cell wall biosynthesis